MRAFKGRVIVLNRVFFPDFIDLKSNKSTQRIIKMTRRGESSVERGKGMG